MITPRELLDPEEHGIKVGQPISMDEWNAIVDDDPAFGARFFDGQGNPIPKMIDRIRMQPSSTFNVGTDALKMGVAAPFLAWDALKESTLENATPEKYWIKRRLSNMSEVLVLAYQNANTEKYKLTATEIQNLNKTVDGNIKDLGIFPTGDSYGNAQAVHKKRDPLLYYIYHQNKANKKKAA
jgi:hypothetical protein